MLFIFYFLLSICCVFSCYFVCKDTELLFERQSNIWGECSVSVYYASSFNPFHESLLIISSSLDNSIIRYVISAKISLGSFKV